MESHWLKRFKALPKTAMDGVDRRETLTLIEDMQVVIDSLSQQCADLYADYSRVQERYQRDMFDLNIEGDPIGGDHAIGAVQQLVIVAERLIKVHAHIAESDREPLMYKVAFFDGRVLYYKEYPEWTEFDTSVTVTSLYEKPQ